MSVPPAAPLAPEWLSVPDDANDLSPRIWPASARRGEDGALALGGVSVDDLAATFGTPLYVVDEAEVRAHARRARDAFGAAAAAHGVTARTYYAGKAFLSTEIVRWVTAEDLSVDVCTRGELEVALAGGAEPGRIGFHGNNKSVSELERAVEVGVGSIIVDSPLEIERLATITERLQTVQRVLVRVRTGVHAETHAFLATAHEDQKFGFSLTDAATAVARIREVPGLDFLGLHAHIGSQIFDASGFRASAARLVELHADLSTGGEIPLLNVGGGFGIAYTSNDDPRPLEEIAAGIVDAVAAECEARSIPIPDIAFEPGRSIVGQAGVTLYEVGTVKPVRVGDDLERVYVSVDGGMSDNARPALYGAQYSARIASRTSAAAPALSRVVGHHCESGDIVVDNEYLPGDVAPGDLVAVPATGAYCFSLASTYNYTPRAAVVAVRDGQARVIVRRESVADLLSRDVGVVAAEDASIEGIA